MHQNTKDEILKVSKLYDVLEDYLDIKKQGNQLYAKCPKCHKDGKGKGLTINKTKGIAKCHSCGWGTNNAFKFLRDTKGMPNDEIWEYLQKKYNIIENIYIAKKKTKTSFCSKQLKSSGLAAKDVTALVQTEKGSVVERDVFVEGTRDQYGNVSDGDDMIIWYYDLEGRPVNFVSKKSKNKKPQRFYRIRWSVPDQHLDKNGKPIKYQSPAGSGTHLYIPQKLRNLYNKGAHIPTLYLQEGEKKAEKACKHGIISVGLTGINAIGQDGRLPYELQLIVKKCNVKNVILVFDADWKEISSKIKDGFIADERPKNFYYAAKNFRDYFRAFTNMDIYLELYISGLKFNGKDKGIDDVLANGLKGIEQNLLEDFEKTINEKSGKGELMIEGDHIDLLKVSDIPDLKLLELWNLHDPYRFAADHESKLKGLKEFKINKLKWKFNEKGDLILAQPLLPDEEFYQKEEKTNKEGEVTGYTYTFNYEWAYNFLRNRGYWKIKRVSGDIEFIEINSRVIKMVDNYYIKDFAINFAKSSIKGYDRNKFMNMLYRGGKMYFGPDSLSNLNPFDPILEMDDKYSQKLYFLKEFWHITAEKIDAMDYTHLDNYIWEDKINKFAGRRLEQLLEIEMITKDHVEKYNEVTESMIGRFLVKFSPDAKKCHFASFIWNTGDFYWRKNNDDKDERSDEEKSETALQFVAKMSAIGYLLHTYFDPANPKAVIGMDGKLSEVGKSNGGSGKSLLGDGVGQVIPQVKINGKKKNMEDDKHLMERVSEKTDNVFIDDVRVNFDFEQLFPHLTGTFEVNPKGSTSFVIPMEQTPKIYIPTNHSLNGEGSSFRRRQFTIPFSDYYNDNYSPRDEFGINFFSEWDYDQWNLFYNFMAECVQVYLKYGFVEAPKERLEQRRLRQAIGEDFIDWADEYFMFNETTGEFILGGNANVSIDVPRIELYNHFKDSLTGISKNYWKARKFKDSIKKYCKFRGARFNPEQIKPGVGDQQIGPDNKKGGVEYFQIAPIYLNNES